eukprot:s482_g16.t1
MAATSLSDSEAAFEKQATHLGLQSEWITGLKRLGINNLGRLAFSCGQPGAPVPEADVRALLQQAVPARPMTVGDVVVMKRLIFEAQTSVVALSRLQADPTADRSARKMPAAERASRLQQQRERLAGLDLQGSMEVAHQVYDTINGMLEADTLKYLAPNKCITRMQEITSSKPPKELKLDSTGQGILVKDSQTDLSCSVSTELDIMEAMTRRSLAFDAAGLIEYEVFQRWVQSLFQLLRQPPPPGFKAPGVTQLLRADRQAFVRMQELTRDGIKPRPDGTRPLDEIIRNLAGDHIVIYYMLPTPEGPKNPNPKPKAQPASPAAPWKGWDKNESSSWRGPKQNQWKKTKGKTGGPGAGQLPIQLKGCDAALPDGTRLCFAYNISGCNKAGDGESRNPSFASANLPKDMAEETHHEAYSRPLPVTSDGLNTEEPAVPFCIEFCSGTGGLTAQLRKLGLKNSFGVDHIVKNNARAPVVKLDLATPEGEALAASYIRSPLCEYCHFGIPCGTSSRAREIEIPGGPKPLRSDDFPEGLPNLSDKEQQRVNQANLVYEAACRLILVCIECKVRWTLEQPQRSLFWLTKFWASVLEVVTPIYVTFQACMFGGQRPKKTTIAGDIEEMQELQCECNGQHTHLPWGRTPHGFATADEVEYPLELCKRWAAIVFRVITRDSSLAIPVLPSHPDKKARALAGRQTRKSLAFMPEWCRVDVVTLPAMPPFTIGSKITHEYVQGHITIPPLARILRITPKYTENANQEGGEAASSGNSNLVEVAYGVPWSVEDFIAEALNRGHPANIFDGLAKTMKAAIRENASQKEEVLATIGPSGSRNGPRGP